MSIQRKVPFTKGFIQVSLILFIVEFVRGAYLLTFLPTFTVDKLMLPISIVGVAVTAHYIADTAVKSFIGYLLDRFSVRIVVHSGLLISLAGLFLTQYVRFPWELIVAASLYGIGASPIWIVILSKVTENDRAAKMGLVYIFWLVGLGMGPVVINFFIDKSYQTPFWILIGMLMFAWLLSLGISNKGIALPKLISFTKQIQTLLSRIKTMKPLLPGMVLQTTAAGMLVPILPGFASKHLGLSYSQYSYVLMTGGVCAVLGLLPMGKLSDSKGKKWFLVAGFGIFAIALYALTLSSTFKSSVILAVVLGISYSAVLPAWNAILSYQVPPEQEGLGWGILSSIEGVGVMLGPILGGSLADFYSETLTVLVSASLLGIIAIFYLLFPFNRLIDDNTI